MLRSYKANAVLMMVISSFAALASFTATNVMAAEEGFTDLFDGQTLEGWEGTEGYWSVEDGAITGTTTIERPTPPHNMFLIHRGEPVEDFELRLKVKINAHNSGIQYRSKELDNLIVSGYQADFEAGKSFSGILYEERGRGALAWRGQRVWIAPDGEMHVEQMVDSDRVQSVIRIGDWNDYTIIARGNHLTHIINGQTTAEVIDQEKDKRADKGILAFQLHEGPPMVVQFKDIRIRRFEKTAPNETPDPFRTSDRAAVVPPERMKTLDGFKAELVYAVPRKWHGSWVSMTVDPKGRLIASNQLGRLYRITLPSVDKGLKEPKIEEIGLNIGMAHGLVYAFDSLYVVVSEQHGGTPNHGLYRVRDTNGDDKFDDIQFLRGFAGGGEHGAHGVILSPDKQSLYIIGGNHTKLPDPEESRVPRVWQEDQLIERMRDAAGASAGMLAPGGWIVKTDPEGKSFELICMGFRNAYDMAFNHEGELFTYDSDLEYDMNLPWYRAPRVVHAVSGADYGWRNGSGKFPTYYPDSLPPLLDTGPGSPTGVSFGYGAKFPQKYHDALFVNDWSNGQMYAVHLQPKGATYEATKEVFIHASPFPITDSVINPKDGAMYFALGGRSLISGLYRIVYTGDADEATERISIPDALVLRREMEQFHGRQDPAAVAKAWPLLDHEDRFVRYAARIAIEHQPVEQWQDRVFAETRQWAIIEAVVALARHGDKSLQGDALDALGRLDSDKLTHEQFLAALRALNLLFIRMGPPSEEARVDINEVLDPLYPKGDPQLDMELARTLVYLNSDSVIEKTLKLMQTAATIEEQVHYAYCLRVKEGGWTMEQRHRYYKWFAGLGPASGGESFRGYIQNIKEESMKTLSDADREALHDVIEEKPAQSISLPLPKGPGKDWTVEELTTAAQSKMKGRDYENGKKMFSAGLCFQCHRFDKQGGAVGPDLTGVGNRFTEKDMLEAIIDPSKVISDQYAATRFTLKDGSVVIGRVANLGEDNYQILTNMFNPRAVAGVNRENIESIARSDVSMMPEDLVNKMNEQEILDLLAYLKSGGDPKHEVFQK